jgi:hypothetical protein
MVASLANFFFLPLMDLDWVVTGLVLGLLRIGLAGCIPEHSDYLWQSGLGLAYSLSKDTASLWAWFGQHAVVWFLGI